MDSQNKKPSNPFHLNSDWVNLFHKISAFLRDDNNLTFEDLRQCTNSFKDKKGIIKFLENVEFLNSFNKNKEEQTSNIPSGHNIDLKNNNGKVVICKEYRAKADDDKLKNDFEKLNELAEKLNKEREEKAILNSKISSLTKDLEEMEIKHSKVIQDYEQLKNQMSEIKKNNKSFISKYVSQKEEEITKLKSDSLRKSAYEDTEEIRRLLKENGDLKEELVSVKSDLLLKKEENFNLVQSFNIQKNRISELEEELNSPTAGHYDTMETQYPSNL